MITLKTITTIELSNDCQLACRYCVNRQMESKALRKRKIMSDEIFNRSLFWLQRLCDAGTQAEVNMNGTGESFLDPQMFSRIRKVKDIMGKERRVSMSTNGLIMTDEIAAALNHCGLDDITISVHRTEVARLAGQMLAMNHVKGTFNFGAVNQPHNWAGQLEKSQNVRILPDIPCHPLIEGRGYISVEGYVSPCCYDYRLLGAFGHVNDDDLDQKDIRPFSLCKDCHQLIPDEIAKAYGVEQVKRCRFGMSKCAVAA
jgi:hypothetical protein